VSEPDHLFVYGTLQPGEVRWRFLAPFVTGPGPLDTTTGRLFDTGWGYPAAVFDGSARVLGRVHRLRPSGRDAALVRLDGVEAAVRGAYRRVEVRTGSGLRAWASEYGDRLQPHFRRLPAGNWRIRR